MEIQIGFNDEQKLKNFAKWLKKEGFDQFMKSKTNDTKNLDQIITCVSTDEKMNWGHYFELE
jgi:ornithine cyclodeaminase/alanine dehydrogenase-like protein (mu-crystallin family)